MVSRAMAWMNNIVRRGRQRRRIRRRVLVLRALRDHRVRRPHSGRVRDRGEGCPVRRALDVVDPRRPRQLAVPEPPVQAPAPRVHRGGPVGRGRQGSRRVPVRLLSGVGRGPRGSPAQGRGADAVDARNRGRAGRGVGGLPDAFRRIPHAAGRGGRDDPGDHRPGRRRSADPFALVCRATPAGVRGVRVGLPVHRGREDAGGLQRRGRARRPPRARLRNSADKAGATRHRGVRRATTPAGDDGEGGFDSRRSVRRAASTSASGSDGCRRSFGRWGSRSRGARPDAPHTSR